MICLTPIAFNRDPKPEKAVSRSEIKKIPLIQSNL
jgi:hypothetical protein